MRLYLSLLCCLFFGTVINAVRIGSFNLHQYGSKKSANATITNWVAELLNDFDLAIVQEISDVSLKAPYVLFDALNAKSPDAQYTMTLSERVGRSATKEQYIFFNRESTSGLEVVKAYIYDDSQFDYFERPPYIGTFRVKKPDQSGVKLFSVMNVHLRPDRAFDELLSMRHVIDDFIRRHPEYFTNENTKLEDVLAQNVINASAEFKPTLKTNHPILIVGDFNADCTYISARRQDQLRTINYVDFNWVITNEVKTNTRQTCTYDRIFVNGDNFFNAIVPGSNTTVSMERRFNLSLEEVLKISDHLPIKFDIDF